jgi:Fic family protein
VGASTRIEGSRMTDAQVDALIHHLSIARLEDRDAQEVAGYYEALQTIEESFNDIAITENQIKNLHNISLRHSEKDTWHRGNYKQHANAVEATRADGTKDIIFQPTPPGIETEDAMRHLIKWYTSNNTPHVLVKMALFVYEFVTIHPFQDGNGRMSRLLATLLLLKEGVDWVQYISFENEIESRKTEYYRALINVQRNRPGEDVTEWIVFWLDCLENMSKKLTKKLETKGSIASLDERKKSIYKLIENYPGSQSGFIATQLGLVLVTVKKDLEQMVRMGLIRRSGAGRGTTYSL